MKRTSAEAYRDSTTKRQKLTNPVRRSSRLSTKGKLKSPFLQLPKEIRLLIYEYLLPCTGVVPSNRSFTDVDQLLRLSAGLGLAGDQEMRYRKLRMGYTNGTWPAILRVNRQIFHESNDLMHTHLSFRVDIFSSDHHEGSLWSHHHHAELHIRSVRLNIPTNLVPHIKHLRLLSVVIWFTPKMGQNRDMTTPYITKSAKAIKDHVNSLVLAMQQSPCLQSVDVELRLAREAQVELTGNALTLNPRGLKEGEIEDAISWYLNPFRILRNIKMSCRYIAAKPSSVIQKTIQDIESEVHSNTPTTTAPPLCALFAHFKTHSHRILKALYEQERPNGRWDGGLPVLYEKLWVAQDTGDLAVFHEAQEGIFACWKEMCDSMEREFEEMGEVPLSW
ncbi:Peroxisomal catalase [Venturia inaequalis]|nr:Peroxisomal catalase [Venturia inaequalis]